MVFSSAVFLYMLLPWIFIIYTALPSIRAKNGFILCASLLLYFMGEPCGAPVLLLSIAVNYAAGRLMAGEKWRKAVLALSVIFNIGLLFAHKYAAPLMNKGGSDASYVLPAGISFFTFQALSYVIDCYRDKGSVQKSLPRLALYISFFPQLIAGPIVRYGDMKEQLESRRHTPRKTAEGLRRFCFGLGKKLIIADTLAAAADSTFSADVNGLNAVAAWTGAVCFALQIYYDFSAYSDMAVGLGRVFGFELGENFNYPYAAPSLTEFWRRWHISLSAWFRDYLYIPLGGSRKSSVRTAANLMAVFLFTGIWHGANLTFLLWGALHGAALILEKLSDRLIKKQIALISVIKRAAMLLTVILTFVIFRADSVSHGLSYILRMLSSGGGTAGNGLRIIITPFFMMTAVMGIIFSAPLTAMIKKQAETVSANAAEIVSYILAAAVFLLSVIMLSENGYEPFIYFRF